MGGNSSLRHHRGRARARGLPRKQGKPAEWEEEAMAELGGDGEGGCVRGGTESASEHGAVLDNGGSGK